jgi:hypothetical protein
MAKDSNSHSHTQAVVSPGLDPTVAAAAAAAAAVLLVPPFLHLLHLQRLKAELAKKKKAGRHLMTKPVNQASQKAHGSLAKVGSSWLVHVANAAATIVQSLALALPLRCPVPEHAALE